MFFRNVSQLTFNGLHGVISQDTELYVVKHISLEEHSMIFVVVQGHLAEAPPSETSMYIYIYNLFICLRTERCDGL
jgi:hypothetical protein